jgi:hypothetical protein
MSDRRSRPTISDRTRCAVWAAAAGRCTFCNRYLLENEDLGEPVPIGELAHNVGWSEDSPRGESDIDVGQREAAENLLLVCRNCHKPLDDGGVVGRYTVDELVKRKRQHEERIRFLSEIGADRAAYIVRVVGHVRGVPPELSRNTVLSAATAAGIYPKRLNGSHWEDVDLDLRSHGEPNSREDLERCLPATDDLVARVHDGVRREAIERVAIFAFARIPVLIYLGARLDDKLSTLVFQRQRQDDANAWRWPDEPSDPAEFDLTLLQEGADLASVALIVCLSGTIAVEELPEGIRSSHYIYCISPTCPAETGPTLIRSPRCLANFEATMRRFLARVEADHGKIPQVSLFAAVPLSAAVTIGRVLMPHISPAWLVFDRDQHRHFFLALEVKR